MKWQIEVLPQAVKSLKELDNADRKRLLNFINNDLPHFENPRQQGKALQGELRGMWRYRVGNFRLLCRIIDAQIVISVVEIGHRSKVYK
ncbi:MAG: type II toxin-antitoxin system RelE/ParE family toxin [Methylococcales bacterium]|nr:type II toxin-antitoxin system RelE/ParE family toxin [Methylococcales bacterium]